MQKHTGSYPKLTIDTTAKRVVSHAGAAALLVQMIGRAGLDQALRAALEPWHKPQATHHPAKVVLDLAVSLAIGGDCLADVAQLRAEPGVFGRVASDPTVSRVIDSLAADITAVSAAIDGVRRLIRSWIWQQAAAASPAHQVDAKNPLIIDLDGSLVTSHSDKEHAAVTFKKGYGFHPLLAFVDHGPDGTGEPLTVMLRPGNAGANTAADNIAVARQALRQLPFTPVNGRVGRKVLIRTDGAGGTKELLTWLTGQGLQYSVGFGLHERLADQVRALPAAAWTAAYDADRTPRDGAWVADLTKVADLSGWPAGMRLIVRSERPHPGAQLRFTDVDGNRLTAFVTNTKNGQLADLELRHRRRARCEDRIRAAKDTGLTNLPLHDFTQNQVWVKIVELACELIAWTQLLALHDTPARRWEPKRLRLRLFHTAGTLARRSRQTLLRLAQHSPHRDLLDLALTRLHQLPTRT